MGVTPKKKEMHGKIGKRRGERTITHLSTAKTRYSGEVMTRGVVRKKFQGAGQDERERNVAQVRELERERVLMDTVRKKR